MHDAFDSVEKPPLGTFREENVREILTFWFLRGVEINATSITDRRPRGLASCDDPGDREDGHLSE